LESDDGKELILKYPLHNNPVAQKFARLIRKIQSKARYEMKHTSWGVYPAGGEALRKLYKDLKSNIEFFDSRNGAGLKVQHVLPPVEKLTPRDLNAIHAEFERLITKTFAVPTGEHNKNNQMVTLKGSEEEIFALEKALNNINGLVHSMEHVIARPPKCYDSFFTSYMSSDPFINSIPLSPEEYKLFDLSMSFGDLFLGYGTTGKSVYHIFKDKDLALVKAGGRPSPQEYVTPNVFAWFGAYHNGTREYGEMVDWLQANKVGEALKLDILDVKHGHGYIKIGHLVKPKEWQSKSENDIIAEISPYHIVKGYRVYR